MKENGFKYVDLGLPSKTRWATCNVGATKPENEGLLFQFGRIDGYKYGDKNYKFKTNKQNKQDTGNEFIPKTALGKTYNAGETLDLADDVAHINMGGKWRMPTKDELQELIDNTTQKVETINEVQGMMFKSIINGCQLFIPFGGWWFSNKYYNAGQYAAVWSSQMLDSYIHIAYRLCCNSSGAAYICDSSRSASLSVRGVFKKRNFQHTLEN